ncbi:hypothetical protein [Ramlibacter henchirensis]|nr:hypothetical protein [Ramlibacter henchirensis]
MNFAIAVDRAASARALFMLRAWDGLRPAIAPAARIQHRTAAHP